MLFCASKPALSAVVVGQRRPRVLKAVRNPLAASVRAGPAKHDLHLKDLPGYTKLHTAEQVGKMVHDFTTLVVEALHKGKDLRTVGVGLKIQATLSEDGKTIELEVASEAHEDDKQEKAHVAYTMVPEPATPKVH